MSNQCIAFQNILIAICADTRLRNVTHTRVSTSVFLRSTQQNFCLMTFRNFIFSFFCIQLKKYTVFGLQRIFSSTFSLEKIPVFKIRKFHFFLFFLHSYLKKLYFINFRNFQKPIITYK